MATVDTHDITQPARPHEERVSAEVGTGGSFVEAIGGIGTVVLAIIGLATHGAIPFYLAAIASIVLGVALLLEGGTVMMRFTRLLHDAGGNRLANMDWGGGSTSVEFLGGAAGIVLGLLALAQVVPGVLLAVSVIVLGGSVLLSAGTYSRLNSLMIEQYWSGQEMARRVAGELAAGANGAQLLAGIAAIILGILALVGMDPLTLALVGFLCLGAAVVLSGTTLTSRMMTVLHH